MNGVCALLCVVFALAVIGQPPTQYRMPEHPAASAHR